jgi:hypothetical protein
MNLERVEQCRQQGAADVSSAELFSDASAGSTLWLMILTRQFHTSVKRWIPMMRFYFVSPAFRAHHSATELALARGDR